MTFLESLVQAPGGPAHQAFSIAEDILRVLTEIRDGQGEGEAQQEHFTVLPFSFDVAGGTGSVELTIRGGTGYLFSSIAVEARAAGGRVTIYAGGVDPTAILQTVDIPGTLVAGTARATENFGENDFAPQNTKITVLMEGAGGDYRMAGVFRGKMFIPGDPQPTTHADG